MKKLKKYLASILTVLFLALFVWYALTHQDMFKALGQVTWWMLALIALGRLAIIFSNGWFTKWTVEAFTDRMSVAEGWLIAVITAAGNFFGPLVGGLGFRAYYLKKYHNLPLTKFTSTLIGYYLIMFMFNSLMAVGGLLFLPKTHQTIYVLIFFGVWFVAMVALAFMRLPDRSRLGWLEKNKLGKIILKILYDIEAGWKVLTSKKALLVKMAGLGLVGLAAPLFMSFIEFKAIGVSVGLAGLLLYTALVKASMLVAVTPDSIGIREAVLVLLAVTIGVTHGQILQIAVIDRGVQFIVLGLLFLSARHSKIRRLLATTKERPA